MYLRAGASVALPLLSVLVRLGKAENLETISSLCRPPDPLAYRSRMLPFLVAPAAFALILTEMTCGSDSPRTNLPPRGTGWTAFDE
jgi:hypothetical protein